MPSSASILGLQPIPTLSRVDLVSVANRLSRVDSELPSWLTVNPLRALQNGVASIASSDKGLHGLTKILFAFGSFGIGFYLYVWKNEPLQIAFGWLGSRFTGSVSIASDHALYEDVLAYLEKNGHNRNAKSLALINSDIPHPANNVWMGNTMYGGGPPPPLPDEQYGPIDVVPEPGHLVYAPNAGSYAFWHNGYRMSVRRREESSTTFIQEDNGKFTRAPDGFSNPSPRDTALTVTCWSVGAGVQPVKDFLDHVRKMKRPSKIDETTIYRASCTRETQKFKWDAGVRRPARTIDSIALEAGKKRSLLKECARYFSKEESVFYASRGLPYRHGLLFYGPPGTGKTSFTVALAGHFKLNVYMISMSDDALNDYGLGRLFESLPRKCIVLLEDIDSSGIQNEPKEVKIPGSKYSGKKKRTVLVGATLSGLLNVLDGPASVDGRLVVMTSNAPDSLDRALLRPGRIDNKILFGYASREVSASIFSHIFTRTPAEILLDSKEDEDDDEENGNADGKDKTERRGKPKDKNKPTSNHPSPEALRAMASRFAASIPESLISPAEVQGFLMRHRDDPLSAVREARAWAEETLQVKAEGRNVASFDNEVKRGGALFAGRGSAPPPVRKKSKSPYMHGDELSESDFESVRSERFGVEDVAASDGEGNANNNDKFKQLWDKIQLDLGHPAPAPPASPFDVPNGEEVKDGGDAIAGGPSPPAPPLEAHSGNGVVDSEAKIFGAEAAPLDVRNGHGGVDGEAKGSSSELEKPVTGK